MVEQWEQDSFRECTNEMLDSEKKLNDPRTECAKELAEEPGSDLETVTKVVPSQIGITMVAVVLIDPLTKYFFERALRLVHVLVHLVDQPRSAPMSWRKILAFTWRDERTTIARSATREVVEESGNELETEECVHGGRARK